MCIRDRYYAVQAVHELQKRIPVELPISEAMYLSLIHILFCECQWFFHDFLRNLRGKSFGTEKSS